MFKPLYIFLDIYVPPSLRFYYKRMRVNNRSNVPKKGPLLFAPNHQNAFMDALMVAGSTSRNPWFMTRASIFGSKLASFMLRSLRMIAIFRIRDGLRNVKRNDAVINECVSLLEKKESILVFPEGDHDGKWNLLPIQKGITRIAFAAEERNDFKLGLKILPTGLQYEDMFAFRSDGLVNYGIPIEVGKYKDRYHNDPKKAANELVAEIRDQLEQLCLVIPNEAPYQETKESIQRRPGRERDKDLVQRLKNDQAYMNALLEKEILPDDSRKTSSKKGSLSFAILGFPIFVWGLINNILPLLTVRWLIKKTVRDLHWTSSIRFVGAIFIAPIFYILQAILFQNIVHNGWYTLIYILTLPFFAIWGYDWYLIYFKKKD